MSDEEFLKRWSRRKQAAKEAGEAPPPAPAQSEDTPPVAPQTPADVEIELAKLPPIDSITAATDITDFLRKGIPAELSRAALRRAWAADPAIRDFVGLAENAWDFTDPTAMAGFGPLEHSPEQIAALVERVVGGLRDTAEKFTAEVADDAKIPTSGAETVRVSSSEDAASEPMPIPASPDGARETTIAAVQPEGSGVEPEEVPVRRRSHGGAMPT